MRNTLKQLDKFHKTKLGYLTFGAVELVVAYGFASWAIDTGSLWLYLLTIISLIGSLQNIYKLIRVSLRG